MQVVEILSVEELPEEPGWLEEQPVPVIAVGEWGATVNADVIVSERDEAEKLAARIKSFPNTALILVQVLRASEKLPVTEALHLESLAYATLQTSKEFRSWQCSFQPESSILAEEGDPILMDRQGNVLYARLNRPISRNAISVEMRDALVDLLELVLHDTDITSLQLGAEGACFSTGGELREFGSAPDAATAHWVRTVQSPARLFARVADRTLCHVHGACIGSGIELPAFASQLLAYRKTFFQLPELQLGLIPGAGGTVSIARRIGRQRLAWLVLSGRRINATTALQWGLIDGLVD